ncbi:hypothetical protein [Sphingobacterium tabacisoli]|uniref:Uncharacterized protein n=1 Tax=Sphingobacterium tabacisoli TaxID=2044855 RepID=A0ABW5L5P8_9SPHI|nr:hypothetical protein [Sphingobacterium tabacisoli]
MLEEFMTYAPIYVEEFQEQDYMWNEEFIAIMERYLPELYKEDPEEVAYWLNGFLDSEHDKEWTPKYVAAYMPKEKPEKKGLLGRPLVNDYKKPDSIFTAIRSTFFDITILPLLHDRS